MKTFDFYPEMENGKLDRELVGLAEEVCMKSASLPGGLSSAFLDSTKDFLQKVNAYHVMMLVDKDIPKTAIDNAFKGELSNNVKIQELQNFAKRHVQMQKEIETLSKHTSQFDGVRILKIAQTILGTHNHIDEELYPSFRLNEDLPASQKLVSVFSAFYYLKNIVEMQGVLLLHVMDQMLFSTTPGYGYWRLSRAIFRNASEYDMLFVEFDSPSAENRRKFVNAALRYSLAEVNYMSENLRIDSLVSRVERYLNPSFVNPSNRIDLPKYTAPILGRLLIVGKMPRSEVPFIIGKKQRTASAAIKALIDKDCLFSKTPKGEIRLKINFELGNFLFPNSVCAA